MKRKSVKLTAAQKLAQRLKTPQQVQRFLRRFPYNREKKGETLVSAERALRRKIMHCFEAAFVAAAILEQHGYPPLVMSLESKDNLDHVIYVFKEKTGWGSIGRSRDEGLHGRPPRYRTLRDLAMSYYDPFVDRTGMINGYQVANLDDCGADWRCSKRNVWKAENYLIKIKHHRIKSSKARYRRLQKRYLKHGPLPLKKHWW